MGGLCLFAAFAIMNIRNQPKRAPGEHPQAALPNMLESLLEPPVVKFKTREMRIVRGLQPVRLIVPGVVTPAKTVNLVAPYGGKVRALRELLPGQELEEGSVLFEMDTAKIDDSMKQLDIEIAKQNLSKQKLEEEKGLTESRVATAENLYQIAKDSLSIREANLAIDKQLFDTAQELFSRKASSQSEMLRAQAAYLQAKFSTLSVRSEAENRLDSLLRLRQSLMNLRYDLLSMEKARQDLTVQKEQIQKNFLKSTIAAPLASKIVEVLVGKEEEVFVGVPLIILRSADEVNITAEIPPSHFKWLFEGSLMQNLEKYPSEAITLKLHTPGYEKCFSGGCIKSVLGNIHNETHGLGIILGRNNPKNAKGELIFEEELKPGMECSVAISLSHIPNSFLVPKEALDEKSLLLAGKGAKSIEVEILYENEEEAIVYAGDETELTILIPDSKN